MRAIKSLSLLIIAMFVSVFLLLSFVKGYGDPAAYSNGLHALLGADDIVIAVKTTEKYHENRVKDIVDTWFTLAPDNIYFVTDAADDKLNETTGGKVVLSDCGHGHTRERLCCKMNAELELFVAHNPRWACHFDDDNYVHLAELSRTLKNFNAGRDFYLGKPSTTGPVDLDAAHDKVKFWFATGGAGFCLSRSLLTKMSSYIRDGGFEHLGERLRLPDDVTLGYLIEHLLNVKLTVVNKFHSHLEALEEITREELNNQISFSAGGYKAQKMNLVDVPERYASKNDPQRFRSLHCFLYSRGCHH